MLLDMANQVFGGLRLRIRRAAAEWWSRVVFDAELNGAGQCLAAQQGREEQAGIDTGRHARAGDQLAMALIAFGADQGAVSGDALAREPVGRDFLALEQTGGAQDFRPVADADRPVSHRGRLMMLGN
ncbi:hypothetical protein RBA09_26075 [Massilia sp. CCM 9029]|nr:hypothetical protein [Massilia sp. CCM 9029]MDQ1834201.1 hypothetical protein [Massilia sp. CCM 9029]